MEFTTTMTFQIILLTSMCLCVPIPKTTKQGNPGPSHSEGKQKRGKKLTDNTKMKASPTLPKFLKKLYQQPLPISVAKKKDLLKL